MRVTLVNFMLAMDGLQAQLLARVVARERPDLQQAKTDLTTQGAEHRRLLQDIEKKILTVLSTSEHLLEDEEAVQVTLTYLFHDSIPLFAGRDGFVTLLLCVNFNSCDVLYMSIQKSINFLTTLGAMAGQWTAALRRVSRMEQIFV